MNNQKPARVKVCACGQAFEVMSRNQRRCPKCIETKKAYEAQHPRPVRNCRQCGEESSECIYGKCPKCQAAERLERKRNNTHIGKYWSHRDYVMREAKYGEGEYGEGDRNDALPLAINGMLSDLEELTRGTEIGRLEIHLLTVARQERLLSKERCNYLLDNVKIHTLAWVEYVDQVFAEFFGRPLDRGDSQQIAADIATLKAMDKHPYIGDHGQAVMHAYNKRHAHRKGRSSQPLPMSDPNWKSKEKEDALDSWVDDFLDRFDNLHGGRFGYLPGTRKTLKLSKEQPQEEMGNAEEVAHADQERIDAMFNELIEGFEL